MPVTIENGKLMINDQLVNVKHPLKVYEVEGTFVVLTDSHKTTDYRDVYGFDARGEQLWQIQEEPKKINKQSYPYTGLIYSDGKLCAFAASGFEYELDPKSGAILSETFVK